MRETLSAPVDSLPFKDFEPDQSPVAVHDVAFVEDQVSVDDSPLATFVGFAINESVGNGKTVTVTLFVTDPPDPVQESV